MNPDKPLAAEQQDAIPHTDLDIDAIPILDEALDLSQELREHEASLPVVDDAEELPPLEKESAMSNPITPDDPKSDEELHIDLGYATESTDITEDDNLSEMEEIQTLPLAEMVLDEEQDALISAEKKKQIETLEAIVFEGENPNVPAPKPTRAAEPQAYIEQDVKAFPEPAIPPAFTPPPVENAKPLPKKSDNPFLPQHILDRLNQGKRNLVEEIAQSSAALDASTAILRTHARAERLSRPTYSENRPQYSFSRDKSAQQKQKMIDDLVEEYLPLIAAELRRRLRKILDE